MQKADSNSSAEASADNQPKAETTFVSSNDTKPNVVGIPDYKIKPYGHFVFDEDGIFTGVAIASLKMSNGDEVQIPSSVEAKFLNILLNT